MSRPHLDGETLARMDDLSGDARRAALSHLRACAACRRELVRVDPARVFALLAATPLPREVLESVSSGVAAGIRRSPRAIAEAPARPWLRAGALAAGLLLAALLGFELTRPLGPVAPVSPPQARLDVAPPAAGVAGVTLLSSRGRAQVFDVTVGDTQVVMIFDEGLEL